MKTRIAIIGAGISGLTLAQRLRDHADVVVYEKARGVGGRMSTRYADPFYFDHGTHTFTARTARFHEFLEPYQKDGTVAEWSGKIISLESGRKITKRSWFEPHLVAAPNMNSLCKQMAEGIDLHLNVEVAPLVEKQSGTWIVHDKEGHALGEYDWVISTAPPAQTITLLRRALVDDSAQRAARMHGCYALMVGFNVPWDRRWIAAKVKDNPIKWVSVNSTKPGRDINVTAIVAHSCNSWADAHIDDDMGAAQTFLLAQFETVSGIDCGNAEYVSIHRWKYAIAQETETPGFHYDPVRKIAATGDWVSTSRVEDAWIHATELAERMILDQLLDA